VARRSHELLAKEKQLTRQRDALNVERPHAADGRDRAGLRVPGPGRHSSHGSDFTYDFQVTVD
jgi:hypothetical protein